MSFLVESLGMGTLAAVAPSPHNVGLTVMSLERRTLTQILAFCLGALATDALILGTALMLGDGLGSRAHAFTWVLRIAGSMFYLHLALRMFRKARPASVGQPKLRNGTFYSGAWVQSCNPNPFLFWFLIGAPRALLLYRESGLQSALLYVGAFLAVAYLGKLALSSLIRVMSAKRPLPLAGLRYVFSPLLVFLAVQNLLQGVAS